MCMHDFMMTLVMTVVERQCMAYGSTVAAAHPVQQSITTLGWGLLPTQITVPATHNIHLRALY